MACEFKDKLSREQVKKGENSTGKEMNMETRLQVKRKVNERMQENKSTKSKVNQLENYSSGNTKEKRGKTDNKKKSCVAGAIGERRNKEQGSKGRENDN